MGKRADKHRRISANLAVGRRWRAKKARYAKCGHCWKLAPLHAGEDTPSGWGHRWFSDYVPDPLYCPDCLHRIDTGVTNTRHVDEYYGMNK